MGVRPRMPVKKLPSKLKAIREALGLSQTELIHRLAVYDPRIGGQLNKSNISRYENEGNPIEPPLIVLVGYADLAGVCMRVLADDKLKLPEKLPVVPPHKH